MVTVAFAAAQQTSTNHSSAGLDLPTPVNLSMPLDSSGLYSSGALSRLIPLAEERRNTIIYSLSGNRLCC